MLSRILGLDPDVLVAAPTTDLRVIASSGSALGSKLATATLDRFGPVLYNLYGSTEVAVATIATPADLLQAPATAGRVALGVRVEILDEAGTVVPDGTVGRVFVGGSMRFEGYTTGGTKEECRGLLSSGDLGYFRDGLLFVEGREDDMIVSGARTCSQVRSRSCSATTRRSPKSPSSVSPTRNSGRCSPRSSFDARERSSPPTRCERTSGTIWRDTRSPGGSSSSTNSRATRPANPATLARRRVLPIDGSPVMSLSMRWRTDRRTGDRTGRWRSPNR